MAQPVAVRSIVAPAPAIAIAATALLGAQAIHTAVLADHWQHARSEGVFFFGLAVAEGVLAAALALTPGHRVSAIAIIVSLATMAVWAWSRTTGLSFGPDAGIPEPVGRADVAATVLEAITALALAPTLRRRGRRRAAPAQPTAVGQATVAAVAIVAAVTAFGVLAGGHVHGPAETQTHGHPTPSTLAP